MPEVVGVRPCPPLAMSVRRKEIVVPALCHPLLQAGHERKDARSDAVCRSTNAFLPSGSGVAAYLGGICTEIGKKNYQNPIKNQNMVAQKEFTLAPRRRGFHLVTEEIMRNLPPLPETGILNLFIKHTSAALSINENADPDVQTDMETIFNHLVKEREPYYRHTCEGDDDMPAHAKSTLVGASLTIPVTNGRLNMGIWQGIYLCEFRNRGGGRKIVATVIG